MVAGDLNFKKIYPHEHMKIQICSKTVRAESILYKER